MRRVLVLLALLPAAAFADGPRNFSLIASFVPAKRPGAVAHVAVRFRALDPDLRLNEDPAPRLRLDLEQSVLIDKQAPRRDETAAVAGEGDPLTARYHDLAKPVLFPVTLAPTAPTGEHLVKGRVIFFYCSQREAWCRRGTREVEIPVAVR